MNELVSTSALSEVLLEFSDKHGFDDLIKIIAESLPQEERDSYHRIIRGEELPSLSSDIIAKKIFSADEHKERVEFLLREVTEDPTIEIDGTTASEGYSQGKDAKKLIFDMPFRMMDQRRGDMEFQIVPQEYIMERAEIYSADMLLAQYSVTSGRKKGELHYTDVKEVLTVVFMRKSPKKFKEFASERYIHRFFSWVADSSMEYVPLRKIVYVQLDKALEQLKKGEDAEKNRKLQILLAAMADINDETVAALAESDPKLAEIRREVEEYAKDKEVQTMLLAEKYAIADYNAVRSEDRKEGLAEGRAEKEKEDVLSAVREGLPQETIMRMFKISAERLNEYVNAAF